MSEYFYIFLDVALVFSGLVLLLIGVFYVGFYLVVRRTGKRLAAQVDLEVAKRLEKDRSLNETLSRLSHRSSLARRNTDD